MATREIEDLRRLIDDIDERIIRLLDERIDICREIGRVKRSASVPVRDTLREVQVLARAGRFRKVFAEIIRLCVEEQGERP